MRQVHEAQVPRLALKSIEAGLTRLSREILFLLAKLIDKVPGLDKAIYWTQYLSAQV